MRGNRFQTLLVKTHAADRHSAAGIDQKNRGHVGQSVRIGDHVSVFIIDQERKRYSELLRKFACGPRIVLGDTEESYGVAAIAFVEAFEKRKCELADGAGDFEEGGDDGAAFQQGVERVLLVVECFERKSWSRVPSNDVRHVVLFSHPA